MTKLTYIEKKRTTKETDIAISLAFCDETNPSTTEELSISTQAPFFTHMLTSMLFHGGWTGTITAHGDVEVDDHHLVEDVGICLGDICANYAFHKQPIQRFGHAVIPMDDALASCTVDFSNRAYLNFNATLPQSRVGNFDISLVREFFTAFTHNARINLHVEVRYGLNSHHMLEAMFKACGKAVRQALQATNNSGNDIQSTKGVL